MNNLIGYSEVVYKMYLEFFVVEWIWVYVFLVFIFVGIIVNILLIVVFFCWCMCFFIIMFYLIVLLFGDILVLYMGLFWYWIKLVFNEDICFIF